MKTNKKINTMLNIAIAILLAGFICLGNFTVSIKYGHVKRTLKYQGIVFCALYALNGMPEYAYVFSYKTNCK